MKVTVNTYEGDKDGKEIKMILIDRASLVQKVCQGVLAMSIVEMNLDGHSIREKGLSLVPMELTVKEAYDHLTKSVWEGKKFLMNSKGGFCQYENFDRKLIDSKEVEEPKWQEMRKLFLDDTFDYLQRSIKNMNDKVDVLLSHARAGEFKYMLSDLEGLKLTKDTVQRETQKLFKQ